MESQNSINNIEPPLCAKGCGFYGSVENMNLCSKCYRECLKEEHLAMSAAMVVTSAEKVPLRVSNSNVGISSASEYAQSCSDSGKKRCQSCNKRVGATGFHCRCGGVFCGMHRYPEEHSCYVDFKKAGREILAKQNPLCKGDKLQCRI